jgi:hypothetical protein
VCRNCWRVVDARPHRNRSRNSYLQANQHTNPLGDSGPPIALFTSMNYEMMKALMETNREESVAPRKAQVKEFPKPDSDPDWKAQSNDAAKEQIAA